MINQAFNVFHCIIMKNFYQPDLAYVHDAGYTDFVQAAGDYLLPALKKRGIRDGVIVDLGCGTGVCAQRLCLAGYEVWGVDISENMLALARQRAPRATFQQASIYEADLPSCRAVTAFGEVLCYRKNETDEPPRTALFQRVYAALQPNGLFVFDMAEPGRATYDKSFWQGKDWVCLVQLTESPATARLIRKITTFRQNGNAWQRHDEKHHLQLLQAADVAEQLRQIGFRVRVLRGYGAYRFPKAYAALVCGK